MSRAQFPAMWRVVPEGRIGVAAVEHFEVDEHASRMTMIGGGYRSYVAAGKYARLTVRDRLAMSDTPYERRTNNEIVRRATGRVLVAGYGLGMILTAILRKPDVAQVVVVESEPDVVALVDPHVRRHVGKTAARKLVVEIGDIFAARSRLRGPFDCLWFDIWSDTSTDTLAEMTRLTRAYRSLRRGPDAFMDCWDREWLRHRRAQERRSGW